MSRTAAIQISRQGRSFSKEHSMRPNQQNRRMRGRGNRKGPNPLTRTYESNGPDVKIRGSAQQIADKYSSLARDAQSSGDRVMAENYLQHAEHYNRLIAAALAASGQLPVRDMRDDDDEGDDERDEMDAREDGDNRAWREQPDMGNAPQPVIEGVPVEVQMAEEGKPDGDQRANQPREGGDDGYRRNRRNRRSRYQQNAEGEAGGREAGRDNGEGDDAAPAAEAQEVIQSGGDGVSLETA